MRTRAVSLPNRKFLYLRRLEVKDVSENYVSWLNDPETVRYLEVRGQVHTLETVRSFVRVLENCPLNYLFAVILQSEGLEKHIGNIKVGGIDLTNKRADLGFLIGAREERGLGYASAAIRLATEFALNVLKLNKLYAGVLAPNQASYKAMMKAGWSQAGRFTRHTLCEGEYVDEFLLEIAGPLS